jgi:hypothetical protein
MTYKGKYPNRIKTVASAFADGGRGAFNLETNAGALFRFVVEHTRAAVPLIGQDIDEWIFHVTPMNDAAGAVEAACGV